MTDITTKALLALMATVLDRLADGDKFNDVVEETGITAQLAEARARLNSAGEVHIADEAIEGDDGRALTLELRARVHYTLDPDDDDYAGVTQSLRRRLDQIVSEAAGTGMFTDDMGAYVDSWSCQVTQVPAAPPRSAEPGDGERRFLVAWTCDLYGLTAMDVARQALAIHRDPESIATVFNVTGPDGVPVEIDLSEDEHADA